MTWRISSTLSVCIPLDVRKRGGRGVLITAATAHQLGARQGGRPKAPRVADAGEGEYPPLKKLGEED